MIIIRSILLAFLSNHRYQAYAKYDDRDKDHINRNLKKDIKRVDVIVGPEKMSKSGRAGKGGKSVLTYPPSRQPSLLLESDVPVGEDIDVTLEPAATAWPSPWPTYYPVEVVSVLPTEVQVGLDMDLIIGVRTPDCPDLLGQDSTPRPIVLDTLRPTAPPTPQPTASTPRPTPPPTPKPTAATPTTNEAKITFQRGALKKNIKRFGFKVSRGLTVRMLAQADKYVRFDNGKRSNLKYHAMPDGAAVIPLSDGYVYVNNAEIKDGRGGVYGLYFDRNGDMVDYKELLSGTSRSCSGGKTPWNTYVSCEEVDDGQCWQVDPDPSSKYHSRPEPTQIGRGYFEAIAIDNRDPSQPVVYVVEDKMFGALRKYTPPRMPNEAAADWTSLHTPGGTTEFLIFIDDKSFTWTSCDEKAARLSQAANFPYPEGIDIKDGIMYFVSKKTYKMYTLDLDGGTYTTMWTNNTLAGDGEFSNSPDQIVRNNGGDFLYFTEDGGSTPGVYALDPSGDMHAIFEAYDPIYKGDETTGLAFSPDGNTMYASFQDCGCEVTYAKDCGCLIRFIRDDGMSFDDESN